jgi:hypothetical protein
MKPTGSLKAFLNVKPNTRVIGLIEKQLIAKPKDTSRRQDVIHPSAMASGKWCHREQYFLLQGFPKAPETTNLQREIVFATGHAIHDRWQLWLKEAGVLYGSYYCNDCRSTFIGLPKDHKIDPKHLEYNEVELKYEPLRIHGSADGLVVPSDGEQFLLEIKSVGSGTLSWYARDHFKAYNNDFDKAFAALENPFPDHINQAQIYMKLMELMGMENAPQEAVLLYEAKGSHALKEFIVKKSGFSVNRKFEEAQSIIDAISQNQAPLCNIGGTDGCNKCNYYTEELLGDRSTD